MEYAEKAGGRTRHPGFLEHRDLTDTNLVWTEIQKKSRHPFPLPLYSRPEYRIMQLRFWNVMVEFTSGIFPLSIFLRKGTRRLKATQSTKGKRKIRVKNGD